MFSNPNGEESTGTGGADEVACIPRHGSSWLFANSPMALLKNDR